MSDETKMASFFVSYSRSDHLPQGLQRTIAELGETRDRLLDGTPALFFVDNFDSGGASANRLLSELSVGNPNVQVLVCCRGVAPTSKAAAPAPNISAVGAASTFTSSLTDYALLTGPAAPYLPTSANQPDWAPSSSEAYPVSGLQTDLPAISSLAAPSGFGAFIPRQLSAHDSAPIPVDPSSPAISPLVVVFNLDLLPELRIDLVRFIDGIRAALCLVLVLVLAALARHPDVRSFVLVLVAASRCYGHRGEPDDHLLPAHRSISVVRGELVLVA